MADTADAINLDENLELSSSGSVSDFEVLMDLKNEPVTLGKSGLKQEIEFEINHLELQLMEIHLKLKSNQELLELKKVQNDEMKRIIDFYYSATENKQVKESTCGCSGKCGIF